MHMRIVRPLSAACVAAAALAASANANAQNNHYHATIHSKYWVFGRADNGGAAIIRADILHQTCNTFVQDFVTHEMWYMTDQSGQYWVEVGVWDGEGTNSITNPCENDVIFWSDSRPNGGGLNNHYFSNGWSFGTYYQAEVTSLGGCTWDVQFGGLDLGTSTSNCPGNGRFLYLGVETTNQGSGSVRGFATGWQAEDGSGNWSAMGQNVAGQGWGTMWMNWDNPPNMEQVANSPWGIQTEEVLGEGF